MNPIKNIIFDFGDVFLNLEKQRAENNFKSLGYQSFTEAMTTVNLLFEKGLVSQDEFLETFRQSSAEAKNINTTQVKAAWNSLLGNLPLHRLEFLESLVGHYRIFLLSNTDSIHIHHFETTYSKDLVNRFYACFNQIYFSFKVHQRKPDAEIYETVLREQNLVPSQTIFVDDKAENTEAAKKLGLHVWHLQVGKEDVVNLPKIIKVL